MTRIDRIAPFLDALPDETFEDFLAAAAYAASNATIYSRLSEPEQALIDAAIGRLDAGQGIPLSDLKGRLDGKLKTAGV